MRSFTSYVAAKKMNHFADNFDYLCETLVLANIPFEHFWENAVEPSLASGELRSDDLLLEHLVRVVEDWAGGKPKWMEYEQYLQVNAQRRQQGLPPLKGNESPEQVQAEAGGAFPGVDLPKSKPMARTVAPPIPGRNGAPAGGGKTPGLVTPAQAQAAKAAGGGAGAVPPGGDPAAAAGAVPPGGPQGNPAAPQGANPAARTSAASHPKFQKAIELVKGKFQKAVGEFYKGLYSDVKGMGPEGKYAYDVARQFSQKIGQMGVKMLDGATVGKGNPGGASATNQGNFGGRADGSAARAGARNQAMVNGPAQSITGGASGGPAQTMVPDMPQGPNMGGPLTAGPTPMPGGAQTYSMGANAMSPELTAAMNNPYATMNNQRPMPTSHAPAPPPG